MKKIVMLAALGMFTFAVNAEEVVVSDEVVEACDSVFGGAYLGLGLGGSFTKYKVVDDSVKNNRFIGTVALGAGKVFKGKFYAGAEGMLDFGKSKTKASSKHADAKVAFSSIVPQIGVRLGYVYADWNTLFYAKVAGAFNRTKIFNGDNLAAKKTKFAPVVALGVEKMFCKKFTTRLEGEYNFGRKMTVNDANFKCNKGFTVRALVAYNVKF